MSSDGAPSWVVTPSISSIGDTFAIFSAESSGDGLICALCASPTNDTIQYAWQVLAGIDSYTALAPNSCEKATASTNATITVTGLTQNSNYTCWFTACNDYPLWPTCIEVSGSVMLQSLEVETIQPESKSESSATLMSIFGAVWLIFN